LNQGFSYLSQRHFEIIFSTTFLNLLARTLAMIL
jgi:hypothetical protein